MIYCLFPGSWFFVPSGFSPDDCVQKKLAVFIVKTANLIINAIAALLLMGYSYGLCLSLPEEKYNK